MPRPRRRRREQCAAAETERGPAGVRGPVLGLEPRTPADVLDRLVAAGELLGVRERKPSGAGPACAAARIVLPVGKPPARARR
ncbi:hypothetical protein ACIO8F_36420 [Streptomyces sp. NPDC087228]|uniref:hypothetical protein n=1 Tax=Streptomyces sp. NPDC087228 TaxID=3365772 RepID=UPI003828EC44